MSTQARMADETGRFRSAVVANALQAEIASGRYGVGAVMPSETDLCSRFGVSRHTAREAVRRLAEAGLVARRQGAGTRVIAATPRAAYTHSLRALDELTQFTRETRLDIADRSSVALTPEAAALVAATPGSRWLRLRGTRRDAATGGVICHATIYVHARFAPVLADLPEPTSPIYAAIEAVTGEIVTEARQEISAGPVPRDAAATLALRPGTTAIRVTRRYLDISGGIMLAALNWHAPDLFSYVISLRREPAA